MTKRTRKDGEVSSRRGRREARRVGSLGFEGLPAKSLMLASVPPDILIFCLRRLRENEVVEVEGGRKGMGKRLGPSFDHQKGGRGKREREGEALFRARPSDFGGKFIESNRPDKKAFLLDKS